MKMILSTLFPTALKFSALMAIMLFAGVSRASALVLLFNLANETLSIQESVTDTPFDPSGMGFAASLGWASSGSMDTLLASGSVSSLLSSNNNTINSATVSVYQGGVISLSVGLGSGSLTTLTGTSELFDYSFWDDAAKAVVGNLSVLGAGPPLLMTPTAFGQTDAIAAYAIPEPRVAGLLAGMVVLAVVGFGRRRARR